MAIFLPFAGLLDALTPLRLATALAETPYCPAIPSMVSRPLAVCQARTCRSALRRSCFDIPSRWRTTASYLPRGTLKGMPRGSASPPVRADWVSAGLRKTRSVWVSVFLPMSWVERIGNGSRTTS
jgi:hypothetical protein